MDKKELRSATEIRVRFNEADSMQIVWHGHYVKYMEDGREDFGRKYGISYMDIKARGYMAPLVSLSCQFKKPLAYGDVAVIETRYVDSDAVKLTYEFSIYRKEGHELVTTGTSVQVLLDREGELVLVMPGFLSEWKKKWGLR